MPKHIKPVDLRSQEPSSASSASFASFFFILFVARFAPVSKCNMGRPRAWFLQESNTRMAKMLARELIWRGDFVIAATETGAPLYDLAMCGAYIMNMERYMTEQELDRKIYAAKEYGGRIDGIINNVGNLPLRKLEDME